MAICKHCGCNDYHHDDSGCLKPFHKCKSSPGTDRTAFVSKPTRPKSRFAITEPREEVE